MAGRDRVQPRRAAEMKGQICAATVKTRYVTRISARNASRKRSAARHLVPIKCASCGDWHLQSVGTLRTVTPDTMHSRVNEDAM
jgi:hypothetical protein